MAWHYRRLPQVMLILALEKVIYVVVWIEWISRNDIDNVFDKDFLAGIFYSIFGVNDMLFLIAFIYIYSRIK